MDLWLLNALKEKIIIKIWPKTGHFPKLRKFCKKIEVSDRISKSLSQQNLRCPSPLTHGLSRVKPKEQEGVPDLTRGSSPCSVPDRPCVEL